MKIQHEYDKGFYTSDACIGCEICRKICPCKNITFSGGRPVWNHACEGCNACVAYCPTKAIQFQTPDAYIRLNNIITRRLGLPEKRTRYHNPHVTAADFMKKIPSVSFHTDGRGSPYCIIDNCLYSVIFCGPGNRPLSPSHPAPGNRTVS